MIALRSPPFVIPSKLGCGRSNFQYVRGMRAANYRWIFVLLALAVTPPAFADAQYDKVARRLDAISQRIETWLAAKQKADCAVPEACDYVAKFRAAQKAWSDWIDAEFAYENYEYGGAGSVVSNALMSYRIEPMNARARKLEQDYQMMKTGH
jgi:hypothetical protein